MVTTHPTEVMPTLPEPKNISHFREWFASQGGYIHPKVYFHPGKDGQRLYEAPIYLTLIPSLELWYISCIRILYSCKRINARRRDDCLMPILIDDHT